MLVGFGKVDERSMKGDWMKRRDDCHDSCKGASRWLVLLSLQI